MISPRPTWRCGELRSRSGRASRWTALVEPRPDPRIHPAARTNSPSALGLRGGDARSPRRARLVGSDGVDDLVSVTWVWMVTSSSQTPALAARGARRSKGRSVNERRSGGPLARRREPRHLLPGTSLHGCKGSCPLRRHRRNLCGGDFVSSAGMSSSATRTTHIRRCMRLSWGPLPVRSVSSIPRQSSPLTRSAGSRNLTNPTEIATRCPRSHSEHRRALAEPHGNVKEPTGASVPRDRGNSKRTGCHSGATF